MNSIDNIYNLIASKVPLVINTINNDFGVYLKDDNDVEKYFEDFCPDEFNRCIIFASSMNLTSQHLDRFKEIKIFSESELNELTTKYPLQYNEMSLPTLIMPGLFIGTLDMISRVDIKALGIHLTINMTRQTIPNNINHLHFPSDDDDAFDLEQSLREASQCIIQYIHNNKNILVFCNKGMSRSGAVVLYVYCIIHSVSATEGLKQIQEFYPKIQPNKGFMLTIEKLLHSTLN